MRLKSSKRRRRALTKRYLSTATDNLNCQAIVACRFCEEWEGAKNTTRMRTHLTECKLYISHMRGSGIVNSITREAAKTTAPKSQQSQLTIPTLTPEKNHALRLKAARVCYVESTSFSLWEADTMVEFLYDLHPAFKPPTRKLLSERLLHETYNALKQQVDTLLSEMPLLNVITDESSNITRARICNISVHAKYASYYYLSEDIGDLQMASFNAAMWIKNHLFTISNQNYGRINSVSTDTCLTIQSTWETLQVCFDID